MNPHETNIALWFSGPARLPFPPHLLTGYRHSTARLSKRLTDETAACLGAVLYQRSAGAPGFEPGASALETEMLSGYTTLLRQGALIPKAGIEPARDVAVTIVLQTTADPFGLFGLAFAPKQQARQNAKSERLHSLKTS